MWKRRENFGVCLLLGGRVWGSVVLARGGEWEGRIKKSEKEFRLRGMKARDL